MDILGSILRFLKSLNLKYEKNCDEHNVELNINDEATNLEGSLHINVGKDKKSEISAKLGSDIENK